MTKIKFFILAASITGMYSCNNSFPYKNAKKLCTDFYLINKNNKFNILYDVDMGDRISNSYAKNDDIYIVFNGVRLHKIYCAIFDSLASITQQKQIYQSRLTNEAKIMLTNYYRQNEISNDTFKIYQQAITNFYKEYNQIKMPQEIPNRNTLIYTNSEFGRQIQFLLHVYHTDEEHYWGLIVCYFPNDSIVLKQYWLDKIENEKKKSNFASIDSLNRLMNYWKNQNKLLKKIAHSWYYKENVRLRNGHP